MERAVGLVGLHIHFEGIRDLPCEAGVDAVEVDGLDVGPILQEELRIGESAPGRDAAIAAVAAVDGHVQRNGGAIAHDPVHVDRAARCSSCVRTSSPRRRAERHWGDTPG